MTKTLNIAHRGASTLAPENTITAFSKALEFGADGLEFDVHLSKDGVPVVIHDEKLDRTTSGRGLVKDHTLAELRALDAGSWFSAEFEGVTIPTLDRVLDEFKDGDLLLNIELKNDIISYPGIEETVIKSVSKRKLDGRVIISSFNHNSLTTCHKINSVVRTGVLYLTEIYEPWNYARSLGCYSVHPFFYHLQNPDIVRGFKEHNLPVYAWTVNETAAMELLVATGIEAIITDNPQDLKKILDII